MVKVKSLALVGYTGFVGSNILSYFKKKKLRIKKYNSKNIESIHKKNFTHLVFAGLPATKWKINQNPKKDMRNINSILKLLKTIKVKKFILISTIDIYNTKEAYGKNRLFFEKSIFKIFKSSTIFRLPALFGPGLKKNILFDLINKNEVEKININNFYQWLNIDDLNFELNKALDRKQDKSKIVELFTEPIKTEQICKLFNIKTNFKKNLNKKVVYNHIPEAGYYKKKNVVLKEIKMFIKDKR